MARRVDPVQDRQRRTALVGAAYQAIFERGYHAVTLADIAAEAGVSRGTLMYHFGSKAGLLTAAMQRFTRTMTAATRRALRQAGTPEAKLRAYVENQFYGVENTRRFYTVWLDFQSAATHDPALMTVQREFLAQTHALDLELARLGASDGADARARQLRALVEGLSLRFVADAAPDLEAYRRECESGVRALLGLAATGDSAP
ncbi:regulatory protein TetR [Deinococcus proteolyticus MRP]|uniref:Regulatory protein TetR n=1 Tax=Deinococcus proteolyticus (strain ATCC 35074 / DSM 20540 / JCM 6276 / NBRC 101906 / NCIMB 13154 / VKM Ac-1939 / CCM 2703 / MRP) TaxID=693977 RepID=F0RP10_DEIPM|nr:MULTISPECIES: TetR family transcriptional regulator [Deinococcus]ADY26419.1 regulatory protein TetR [Deinococcus proteolyticus MRP]MCY1702539.1 TetR family transcriptional regulator [Deinococcus sp. SL84]